MPETDIIVPEKRKALKTRTVRETIPANLQKELQQDGLSAYDVMKEARGIIKSGHRDLATNPKYLNRFGRD